MNISGYTVVRNAIQLDYPVELTIRSMLPVCAEVLVCDSDSTDGTKELLQRLADEDPRIRIINRPWPNPRGDSKWFVDWLNYARERLTHPMQLQLDADEVLSDTPECHQVILSAAEERAARRFNRLNFWRDPFSLIPDGHCCGKYVTRMGKTDLWMPSDEPHHKGECEILDTAQFHSDLVIFHLGFIRRTEAFYQKANVVLHAFFNRYDTRLESAQKAGKPLWESECEFSDKLVPYLPRYYPEAVKAWLRERGYKV